MSTHLEQRPAAPADPSNARAAPRPKWRFVPFRIWGGWAIAVIAAIISLLGQKQVVVVTDDNKRLEAELASRDLTINDVRRQMQEQSTALSETRRQLSQLAAELQQRPRDQKQNETTAGGLPFDTPPELDGVVPGDGNYQGTVGVCRGGVEPRDVHGSGQLCIQSTAGVSLKMNMNAMTRTRYAESIRREQSIPGDPSIGFYELNVGDAVSVHVENGLARIITILRQRPSGTRR